MKVIERLKNTDRTLFSFELLPPLKGRSLEEIFRAIDPLTEFDPLNINVTYHQQESVYRKRSDGLVERKVIREKTRYCCHIICDPKQIQYYRGSAYYLWWLYP